MYAERICGQPWRPRPPAEYPIDILGVPGSRGSSLGAGQSNRARRKAAADFGVHDSSGKAVMSWLPKLFVNQRPSWSIVERTGQRVTLPRTCRILAVFPNGGSAAAARVRGFAIGPAADGSFSRANDSAASKFRCNAPHPLSMGRQRSACDRYGVRHGSL
jgi:hypothetical protein